ncbi:MAG TPA: hypothetical protein VGO67_24730 [Verrucomicrobiae bacterium]|jgi:hypothetical protein
MKKPWIIAMAAVAGMLSGCATSTVLRVPVGPDPASASVGGVDGTLKVFSAKEQEDNVGFENPYNQRTDYYVYDSNGKEAQHVTDNNKGHFEAIPRGIELPPGRYSVKALAAVGLGEWVTVPVVIESGRTTEVHLNGSWRPPSDTPQREIVQSPGGFPMGWRAPGGSL